MAFTVRDNIFYILIDWTLTDAAIPNTSVLLYSVKLLLSYYTLPEAECYRCTKIESLRAFIRSPALEGARSAVEWGDPPLTICLDVTGTLPVASKGLSRCDRHSSLSQLFEQEPGCHLHSVSLLHTSLPAP